MSTTMKKIDTEKLRDIAKAASTGPWKVGPGRLGYPSSAVRPEGDDELGNLA